MPRYDYRCADCGDFERFFHVCDYDASPNCTCGRTARRVFKKESLPLFNIDKEDQQFNLGAGQFFSNRGEKKQWMDDNGAYEICPEEAESAKRGLKELREAKADLGDAFTGDLPGRKKDQGMRLPYEPFVHEAVREMETGVEL